MKVTLVPPEHVANVWPKAAPLLERATKTVRLRADVLDLFEHCLKGYNHLWIVFDEENDNEIVAAVTTQIIEYPRYKTLSIQYMGGKGMNEWFKDGLAVMEKWAKECGCETIEGYGRDAWLRFTKGSGFKKAYVTFEKEIT